VSSPTTAPRPAPASGSSDPGSGDRPTLLLLDGHSIAYRAFFALPAENFKTVTGQTTNAVYGFTAMLINLLRDEKPTHVAAAFDVSRQTFRAEAYPEYKANRTTTPDEFRGQVELTKDVLGALGIPVMAIDGFEADDRPRPRVSGSSSSPVTATPSSWSTRTSPCCTRAKASPT
jgi:DNA polymerase I